MMHDPTGHPDDERLSALAAGDEDATKDAALGDHVTSCGRCSAVVDDLLGLRTALAQLPDLAPPRPLRLLPGVPEPAAPAGGLAGLVRRLVVPALAAGLVLTVGGGIGALATGGISGLGAGSSAAYRALEDTAAPAPAEAPAATARGETGGSTDNSSDASKPPSRSAESLGVPWLGITLAGLALLVGAAILRFGVQPRAG